MSHAGQMTKVKFPHRRVDPHWGESYGPGPHYVTRTGLQVWMHRDEKTCRVRFFDRRGNQIESESGSVAGAIAGAIELLGWKSYRGVDDAGGCWVRCLISDRFGRPHIAERRILASQMCEDCGNTHPILVCREQENA